MGSFQFTAAQLKIMQEVITLVVFGAFSILYLKQELRWNYLLAFAFIIGAVFFVFFESDAKLSPKVTAQVEVEAK